MTPEQTKKRMAVMAKHGEPGWIIQWLYDNPSDWKTCSDPGWAGERYRAARIELQPGKRVPLPWKTLRCGMVVLLIDTRQVTAVVVCMDNDRKCFRIGPGNILYSHETFTTLEYLDGDVWRPLWTEELGEEKIVETVTEE